jgi:protease-4
VLALLVGAGCHLPQPIEVRTHIAPETTPPVDASPIVEMPVGVPARQGVKVAIIDVDGLIVNRNSVGLSSVGNNPVANFRAKLDYVRRHRDICGVVLRIHSPGGGVTASDIMWRDLQRFRAETGRPVIACLMDVAAGGGYYLATGCDLIMAHPTTLTGGIGVIFNAYNLEDFLAQLSITGVQVKSGKYIDLGSPLRRIPDEGRELLQQIADDFRARFQQRVSEGRGLPLSGDEVWLDGRVLTAEQAREAGLIDGIGYLDDAVAVAAEQSGGGAARTVLLHRCRDRADTPYAITPNDPITNQFLPLDVPGLSRPDLPTFLYLWQPNPSYAN